MNNETNVTVATSSNFGKLSIAINKIAVKGVVIEGFSANANIGYTDDGLRAELDASMQALLNFIAPAFDKVYEDIRETEKKNQERRDREAEARIKVEAEQTKYYTEQTKYYEKMNKKLDLEIEALQKKSAE